MYLKINFIFVLTMTEILLYGSIDGESSSDFIEDFTEKTANNEDVVVRVNTPGGNPEYTFGMVAKFSEYTGKKKIQVDGKAYSGGLYFLCYGEENESLDVSEFLLHRAAYPSYYENDVEFFTFFIILKIEFFNHFRINSVISKNNFDFIIFFKLKIIIYNSFFICFYHTIFHFTICNPWHSWLFIFSYNSCKFLCF